MTAALLKNAPATFKSKDAMWKNFAGSKYTLQVAPEDCTGCALCIEACPAKSKTEAQAPRHQYGAADSAARAAKRATGISSSNLPEVDRSALSLAQVKDVQLLQPLFEFSGACSGCGETPYVKLMTQLFGDRTVVGNATGCTSIYGGNLPTTPYTFNKDGRGIAWSNSLFEDAAEFGLGVPAGLSTSRPSTRGSCWFAWAASCPKSW